MKNKTIFLLKVAVHKTPNWLKACLALVIIARLVRGSTLVDKCYTCMYCTMQGFLSIHLWFSVEIGY